MVGALRAHPDVEVFDFRFGSPAAGAALSRAEQAAGMTLPDAILEFYTAHNGVFLEWGLRGSTYTRTDPYDFPDYDAPPGCINLLPIAAAFQPDWQRDFHVNELLPGQEELFFGQQLDPERPLKAITLDNFSKYNHADLIVGPEPVVLVSTDHGADLDSSDFMSFETYLDVTLAVFGSNRFAAVRADKPARLISPRERPTLDAIVAYVREDER
ncbi:SMI1/KNR4 family protein [Polyangium mundeleinium]|uniref:SMI1/KNR4 family protein n=1 Tax=Polyangium mundeleinium TaxID=2995306 RepID=A0ABT5EF23_9BACT|nr:SMI1/KNR4 family protein [Polyangium mundeleinium]MDC0740400.1 SMI1/KNR4 family protein [Polyangium mundeleinium]